MTAKSLRVYLAYSNGKKTYLGGCNEIQKNNLIITDTWRFKKLCRQKPSLDFPFYVIQRSNGSLLLLK
mgnify:FL=1